MHSFATVFLFISGLLGAFSSGKLVDWPHNKHIDQFNQIGKNQTSPSDKVAGHTYGTMYGMFLMPMQSQLRRSGTRMKMFEIGLGCGMNYGPGASVALWRGVFTGNTVDLWEGEYDAECVAKSRKNGQLFGINTVTG
jgi:hypothetical protein